MRRFGFWSASPGRTSIFWRCFPSTETVLGAASTGCFPRGKGVVKIGRTRMQDATPITLGEKWSGYMGRLSHNLERIEDALQGKYRLALGGTAVGTGINAAPGFGEAAAAEISKLTNLPFIR